jgi:hypothetical protein
MAALGTRRVGASAPTATEPRLHWYTRGATPDARTVNVKEALSFTGHRGTGDSERGMVQVGSISWARNLGSCDNKWGGGGGAAGEGKGEGGGGELAAARKSVAASHMVQAAACQHNRWQNGVHTHGQLWMLMQGPPTHAGGGGAEGGTPDKPRGFVTTVGAPENWILCTVSVE